MPFDFSLNCRNSTPRSSRHPGRLIGTIRGPWLFEKSAFAAACIARMTPDTLKISSKPGVAMGEGLPRDYYDPDAKLPRLPMPYRMIDNVLRDLIEDALEQARDDPPREEPPAPIAPSFSLDTPDVVSLQPTKNGLMIFVGTRSGKVLCVNSLRGDVVGEPIDLEEPINCMTLAADERLLAVAVGGVSGVGGEGEEVEPKPSTVKLMLVQQDRPFLKTMTSTKLSAAAVSISFSFDSCVFAARLCTNQLECFRTMIQVPLLVEEEVEPASPLMGKKLGAGVAEGVEGADPEAREAAPEGAKVTEPFRVLLTSERPAPPAAAGTTVVMLGSSPRVRQVGELESKHCACVHIVILDTHLVEKFRLRESALPPPAEGEEEAAPPTTAAEQQLRLPHAVTAVAMDTSTVLMMTGLANGACVVWNTVFGTQLFALKRHKAAVCAASFTHYQQPGETPLLVTAGADGVIHIHSIENGELLSSFEHKAPVPRILRILPTCIPLVLFQYDQLRGGGADRGGGVPEGSEESAVLEVFSLVDCSTKAVLTLPAPYMQGARRVRVELPMLGGGSDLGEMVGALTLELPPDLPPRAEGEEEEEVAAEGGGGEGEVEEEGAKEKGKGRWKVVAFRMIDMLAVAFPHMVKTQYGSWIQTSAKDTYWQHVGGRLAQTAGNAVTDRYLSDAAIVAGRGECLHIGFRVSGLGREECFEIPVSSFGLRASGFGFRERWVLLVVLGVMQHCSTTKCLTCTHSRRAERSICMRLQCLRGPYETESVRH